MRSPEERSAGPIWWLTLAVTVLVVFLLATLDGWLRSGGGGPIAPANFPSAAPPGPTVSLLLDVDGTTDLDRVATVLATRGESATLVGAQSQDSVRTARYVDGPADTMAARVRAAAQVDAPLLLTAVFDRGAGARIVTMETGPGDPTVLRDVGAADRSCPALVLQRHFGVS